MNQEFSKCDFCHKEKIVQRYYLCPRNKSPYNNSTYGFRVRKLMKKIIVLVGCSGSGKSTWAHEQWEKDPQNVLIVSRDKLRELLFGYSELYAYKYYERQDLSQNEKQVSLYMDTLIHDGLNQGKTVIVDASHLNRKYIEEYRIFNVPIEYKVFSENLDVLISRDNNRLRSVGPDVIRKQFNRFNGIKGNLPLIETTVLHNDVEKPRCVIFDVDGTLARKGDRDIYDGSKLYLDTPINPIVRLQLNLSTHVYVIVCSGRSNNYSKVTEDWLYSNGVLPTETHFRNSGDNRPDWIVKEEMWRDITDRYYIDLIIDDRNQVVRRARALGLKVAQVEYGNF